MGIKENYSSIKEKIGDVRLIAVTKKRSLEEIKESISCGVDCIAESQLQEAMEKIEDLNVKKYFVGHLQTNKARKVVEMFDVIESVDSLKIAKEIDKHALNLGKIQEIYFQVNIGEEDSKYGIGYEEALSFYDKLVKFVNIKIIGVMCIAPLDQDPRPFFKKMKILFDKLPVNNLSMGMSDDYEIAIEEGSNEVRIGRKLFL